MKIARCWQDTMVGEDLNQSPLTAFNTNLSKSQIEQFIYSIPKDLLKPILRLLLKSILWKQNCVDGECDASNKTISAMWGYGEKWAQKAFTILSKQVWGKQFLSKRYFWLDGYLSKRRQLKPNWNFLISHFTDMIQKANDSGYATDVAYRYATSVGCKIKIIKEREEDILNIEKNIIRKENQVITTTANAVDFVGSNEQKHPDSKKEENFVKITIIPSETEEPALDKPQKRENSSADLSANLLDDQVKKEYSRDMEGKNLFDLIKGKTDAEMVQIIEEFAAYEDKKREEERQRRKEQWAKPIEPPPPPPQPDLTKEQYKRKAREDRISQIETLYPDYMKVCIRENTALNVIRRRMHDNYNYDPFTKDCSQFRWNCNDKYAHMDDDERDQEFIKEMKIWMPPEFMYSPKEMKMIKAMRIRADNKKADYFEYTAAQYDQIPWENCWMNNFCSKNYSDMRYDKWVSEGSKIPMPYGNPAVEMRRRYDKNHPEQVKTRKRRDLAAELEKERESLIPFINEMWEEMNDRSRTSRKVQGGESIR